MNFGLSLIFIITLSIFSNVYGQEKSNNNDLRVKRAIFFIKEILDKENETYYKLLTTINGQFNFEVSKNQNVKSSRKVDSSDAIRVDERFVDNFISFKYLMQENKKKKCVKKYYLNLRGEDQVICQNEKKKIEKLEEFISELKKRFT